MRTMSKKSPETAKIGVSKLIDSSKCKRVETRLGLGTFVGFILPSSHNQLQNYRTIRAEQCESPQEIVNVDIDNPCSKHISRECRCLEAFCTSFRSEMHG